MLTGSLKSFQRYRRVLTGLALVAPLLLLGAAYWLIGNVLLVPRVPDQTTSALDCVGFICHEKGLPRLSASESEAYLLQQTRRFLNDTNFARQFAAALRTSTPSELQAYHENVLGAFKPLFMRDVDKWHALTGDAKASFLDQRIVEYNRMSRMAARAPAAGIDLGPGLDVDKLALLKILMDKTTEQERDDAAGFLLALKTRIEQILADPALHEEFEKRIGISPPE